MDVSPERMESWFVKIPILIVKTPCFLFPVMILSKLENNLYNTMDIIDAMGNNPSLQSVLFPILLSPACLVLC